MLLETRVEGLRVHSMLDPAWNTPAHLSYSTLKPDSERVTQAGFAVSLAHTSGVSWCPGLADWMSGFMVCLQPRRWMQLWSSVMFQGLGLHES